MNSSRILGVVGVAGIFFLPHFSWAQQNLNQQPSLEQVEQGSPADPASLQQQIGKNVRKSDKHNLITIVYENDLIGSGSDEYYTSGVRISYLDINAKFPKFAHNIDDIIPTFSINDTSSIFYSLGQNIFTPKNVNIRNPDSEDRPYAGYLYGSLGMVSITGNHVDELEVSLGVVGPASMAEQTQKFIHRHITDSPMPKGWNNQLDNEPALTVGWQRSWPEFRSFDTARMTASVSPYAGVTAGNVYDFVNTGLSFRISPSSEQWQDTPVRVRPALPGTGFFQIPENKWSWYIFGGIEGRAIARNIFLDGNTFSDSPSVDKEYFVGDANAGIAFTYDQIRLSYTINYRTKEFETQEDSTTFGAMSLGYRF